VFDRRSSVTYVITMGAAAPFGSLERAIHRICQDVHVLPDRNPGLHEAFPEASDVTFVVLHKRRPGADASSPGTTDADFVRARHTPTAALRQIISGVTHAFGTARLLVSQGSVASRRSRLNRNRAQTMTLAGFLRSGKVLQEDTLIKIELPRKPRHGERRSA
jgi:hypothetical protein